MFLRGPAQAGPRKNSTLKILTYDTGFAPVAVINCLMTKVAMA